MTESMVPVRQGQIRNAEESVDELAWNVLVAMDEHAKKAPQDKRSEPGKHFSEFWQQSGLNGATRSLNTDPMLILKAAYRLTQTADQKPLTLATAAREVYMDTSFAVRVGVEDRRRAGLESRPDSLTTEAWLKHSVERLAKAVVVRDSVRLETADRVVDAFARQAIVAMDDYATSFPEADRTRAAEYFAEMWDQLDLEEATADLSTDSARILKAARGLTQTPVSLEVDAAAVQQAIAELRQDVREGPGEPAKTPSADDRLKRSLALLAKASIVRDIVKGGAAVEVDPVVQAQVNTVLEQGEKLEDARHDLQQKSAKRDAERRDVPIVTALSAVPALAGTMEMSVGGWGLAFGGVNAVVAAGLVASSWVNDRRANRALGDSQATLGSARTWLGRDLDRVEPGAAAPSAGNAAKPRNGGLGR